MLSTDLLPVAPVRPIDDVLTDSMAETLAAAPIDLGCVDSTVRVLLEARFMAREIVPRLDRARGWALFKRAGIADAPAHEGRAAA